jgi:hypothetical protein
MVERGCKSWCKKDAKRMQKGCEKDAKRVHRERKEGN